MPTFNTPDNATINYYEWLPLTPPKAVVIIVHGLSEHAARYAHVAKAWNADGYAVYALDHRGHGKSSGERSYFPNFGVPVVDLKQFFDIVKEKHPHEHIFMYGHSMGTGISLLWALEYQRELRGLLLSGTVITVEEGSNPLVVSVGGLLAKFIPLTRAVPSLPSSELSTDAEQVRLYDADPLVDRGQVRLGMGNGIIQAGRDIRARAQTLTVPMLVLHGDQDKICPPSGSSTIYELASSPDKTLKLYPGLRHELVNEIGRDGIIAEMLAWMNQHL
jgi:acylglycerol lipase